MGRKAGYGMLKLISAISVFCYREWKQSVVVPEIADSSSLLELNGDYEVTGDYYRDY